MKCPPWQSGTAAPLAFVGMLKERAVCSASNQYAASILMSAALQTEMLKRLVGPREGCAHFLQALDGAIKIVIAPLPGSAANQMSLLPEHLSKTGSTFVRQA